MHPCTQGQKDKSLTAPAARKSDTHISFTNNIDESKTELVVSDARGSGPADMRDARSGAVVAQIVGSGRDQTITVAPGMDMTAAVAVVVAMAEAKVI